MPSGESVLLMALRIVVLDLRRGADRACGLTTPRATNVFAIKPAKSGWKVSVRVVGRTAGASLWLVQRGRGKPSGAPANGIAAGCR